MNWKSLLHNKQVLGISLALLMLVAVIGMLKPGRAEDDSGAKPTPKPEPVNVIPVSQRPYVTLQPKSARNQLELIIHDLKLPAEAVEVTLEYDRNKGILDAVLRNFSLDTIPLVEALFMGSESAGGHITYHDDVVGGLLHLEFEGDESYALEVPWRYDDTQTEYSQISTADQKFQVELTKPIKTSKVLVMQSPGLPLEAEGEVIAGPYLFRTPGSLPDTDITVKFRLPEATSEAKLLGFDGAAWQPLEATVDGKQLTATEVPVYEVYVVTK
jgi:hypothetical protein